MNEYFLPGSVPATNAPGSSATIRAEFANVAAAFDKLPVMAGNANEFVLIDPTGTGLTTSGFMSTDMVTLAGAQPLTNKTLSWAGNTWVGFGTAATKVAGTGPGQVLLLAEDNKLPAMDGSNLTDLNVEALGVVPVSHGGTGADTIEAAKSALGVDLKADANNAVLSGAPVCPTPAEGDSSAKIANTFFVNQAVAIAGGLTPSNNVPVMNGVGAPGVAIQASRADHVHPTDTSLATTAFVAAAVAAGGGVSLSSTPAVMDGIAATGAALTAARADHAHPTDTSRAAASAATATGTSFTPAGGIAATNVQTALAELDTEKASLVSPAFTGNPTAPTPLTTDNDTSIATTAYVQAVVAAQPAGMSPSNDVPLIDGVASAGNSVTGARSNHVHPTDTSRASAATLTGHTGNTSNPHSTTKAQIGLGNVDDTSDAVKNAAVVTLTNKTLDAANCKLGAVTGLLKAAAGVFSEATAGDVVALIGSSAVQNALAVANGVYTNLENTYAAGAVQVIRLNVGTSIGGAALAPHGLEIRGNGTGGAFMTFHRPGQYAAFIGLDTDNKWKVGGWSMGNIAYDLIHAGLIGTGLSWDGTHLNCTVDASGGGVTSVNGAAGSISAAQIAAAATAGYGFTPAPNTAITAITAYHIDEYVPAQQAYAKQWFLTFTRANGSSFSLQTGFSPAVAAAGNVGGA